MTRLRRHLTYANVISTLCLFLLLGGGSAYALSGSNTVFSDDIVDGEVRLDDLAADSVRSGKIDTGGVQTGDVLNNNLSGTDVLNNSLGSADVLDATLTGGDVANNSLKGADVDESTLSSFGGADVCDGLVRISTSPSNQDQTRTACAAGPLSIEARCVTFESLTEARLSILNSADHSFYAFSNGLQDSDWNTAEGSVSITSPESTDAVGLVERFSFSMGANNGSQLAGEVGVRVRHLGSTTGSCQFALGVIG